MNERMHLRIGVTTGLGLHFDVVRNGAFNKIRYILGCLGSCHGDRFDWNIQVVPFDPG